MAPQNPEPPKMEASISNSEATSSSSSTQTQDPSRPQPPKCAACSTPQISDDKSLKDCLKCHTAAYCTKECQKADFKKHKKVCAQLAQEYTRTADFKMASGGRPLTEGHRGGLQKWQFDTEQVM